MPPLDGCDTMENFLNLLWLTIAAAALLTAPRRPRHTWLALGCALALLFPIVSVSDDLADRDVFEEALALLVKAVTLTVAFVAIGKIESIRPRRVTLCLIPLTDPRSPPVAA
jgi:hypothetical protein